MGLARFHFDAVIPDRKRKGSYVLSDDPDGSMSEEGPGDMFFLHDQTERGLVADCPYLWFIERAGGDEEDDDEDDKDEDDEGDEDDEDDENEDGEDEVERFSGGDDPKEILELLDGLERALVKHGSTPPVQTMFYWADARGQGHGSSVVIGTLDGQECRLYGGWDRPSLNFLNAKPKRPSKPITGGRIMLETNRDGSPEIEIRRTTLAEYYRPYIDAMRAVCKYAIKKKGFVRSSFVL
jgi:hypothetical protein